MEDDFSEFSLQSAKFRISFGLRMFGRMLQDVRFGCGLEVSNYGLESRI